LCVSNALIMGLVSHDDEARRFAEIGEAAAACGAGPGSGSPAADAGPGWAGPGWARLARSAAIEAGPRLVGLRRPSGDLRDTLG